MDTSSTRRPAGVRAYRALRKKSGIERSPHVPAGSTALDSNAIGCGAREGHVLRKRVRRIHRIESFELESGEVLRDVEQAYHLDGKLNEDRDNAVVIFHALTGSADAVGDWWSDVLGPGRAVDTERYAIVCANFVGSCYGSTGPSDPARRPFPRVTTRDLARLVRELIDHLGIRRVRLATGGSLGGMVALEWAASYPELTDRTVVFAAPASHTAAAIGWSHIQRRMIEAAGDTGLEIARMVAMMTYRTAGEFQDRFGRDRNGNGSFSVESYLSRHGEKLLARFDADSYLTLLETMDAHDVGKGRGGAEAVLRPVGDRLIGVGIPGDLLYREEDVLEWVRLAGATYRQVHSKRGHDGFLLEPDQVGPILTEALGAADVPAPIAQIAGGRSR
ncbi:MAG: homoserine O-acetyltransferase [Gemmatimonas sp.]|nr:homoserine O-acetyltransferase [Gemmatimonas sp.]